MRKTIAILFATMILLSSGFAQAVLHICPQDGVSILEDNCTMHKPVSCCDEENNHHEKKQSDCCEDAYFFAVSPKCGSVKDLSFSDLGFLTLHFSVLKSEEKFATKKIHPTKLFEKPPLTGRDILAKINCLTI